MDISGSYLYSQNETSFVTSRMRFVGKLPLMLSFTNIPQSGSVVETVFSTVSRELHHLG